MKVLIHDLVLSPWVWAIVVFMVIGISCLTTAFLAYQRMDYDRLLELRSAHAVEQITKAIADLKVKEAAAVKEHLEIKKTVEAIKEDVREVKKEDGRQ